MRLRYEEHRAVYQAIAARDPAAAEAATKAQPQIQALLDKAAKM